MPAIFTDQWLSLLSVWDTNWVDFAGTFAGDDADVRLFLWTDGPPLTGAMAWGDFTEVDVGTYPNYAEYDLRDNPNYVPVTGPGTYSGVQFGNVTFNLAGSIGDDTAKGWGLVANVGFVLLCADTFGAPIRLNTVPDNMLQLNFAFRARTATS